MTMKNEHQRFGKLVYVRRTDKASTNIRIHLDAFIGEERGKAHFVSIFGGDVEIGAIAAAFSNGDLFTVIDPMLAENIVSPRRQATAVPRFDCNYVLVRKQQKMNGRPVTPLHKFGVHVIRRLPAVRFCDFYIHCFCFVWLDLRIESGYSWCS